MTSLNFLHIITGLFLFSGNGRAQVIIHDLSNMAHVNWSNQFVYTNGTATVDTNISRRLQRVRALEDAKIVVQHNLRKCVMGMILNSELTVEDVLQFKPNVRKKIVDALQNFTITDVRLLQERAVEIDIEFPILKIIDAFLAFETKSDKSINQYGMDRSAIFYTGLVIYTKGHKVTPALAPQIFNSVGHEVYGFNLTDKEYVKKYGVVGYGSTMGGAYENERVGKRPLILYAIKSSGKHKTDVVISNRDANVLKQNPALCFLLHQCRVLFIVD